MLQQGFDRSAEQNRGLGGDIRLKSGPYHLLLFLLLHGGRPGSGQPSTALENILPQERYQLVAEKSAVFTMNYANARVMTLRPKSIVRNNEEGSWASKRFPWYRAT